MIPQPQNRNKHLQIKQTIIYHAARLEPMPIKFQPVATDVVNHNYKTSMFSLVAPDDGIRSVVRLYSDKIPGSVDMNPFEVKFVSSQTIVARIDIVDGLRSCYDLIYFMLQLYFGSGSIMSFAYKSTA